MKPTSHHRRLPAAAAAGTAAVLACLLGAASPAAAAPSAGPPSGALAGGPRAGGGSGTTTGTATLAAIQARSAAAIAARQGALKARLAMVTSGSPHLTAAHRQALITLISNDQAGLAALGTKIAGDTDVATARADHQQIFTGYRVYALVLPQVRLVRVADAFTGAVLPRLTDARTRLAAAAAQQGKTDEVAAQLADLDAQIAAIRTATEPVADEVLALTPAQWNADHSVLAGPRQALLSAREATRKARADIVAIRKVLKS